jgi:F-type H+-transporting ATPase subunit b
MRLKNLLGGALLGLPASPLLASEAASGGGGGPFSGDVGTALWTLVIFVLVVLVLGKYAWGPLLSGLQARERFIREALEAAKRDREAAEARLKEYEQKLATARDEATAVLDEARRDAEALKRTLEADGRAEGQRMIERAKREIGIAADTAVKQIYDTSARLATELAGKILQREIRPEDHERLIREALDRVRAGGQN